jgi:acyl transferase domain-containing protein
VLGAGTQVDLPTYAFQHQRYWPEPSPGASPAGAVPVGRDGASAAVDAEFWAAVEGGDIQGLSQALAVQDQQLAGVIPALAAWRRRELDRSAVSGWRYRIIWAAVPDPAPATLTGTWLMVLPAGQPADLAAGCARALAAAGAEVVVAEVPADDERAAVTEQISRLSAGMPDGISGIVSLLALTEEPVPGYPAVPAGLAGTQTLVQALGDADVAAPLWVLTCGAVSAGAGEVLPSPAQAAVWGLGRVAALEHPDRWGGLIDLPATLDERAAGWLTAVLAGCGEDQVAVRDSGVHARRLTRGDETADRPVHETEPAGPAGRWVPRGSVLVTGGTGAIGGHAARLAAARGAARIVLTSRSGPSGGGAAGLAAELAGAGSAVAVLAGDVADRAQVAGLLDWTVATGPAVTAVLHTAGAPQATPLAGATVAGLADVVTAKTAGAAHLDELTAGLKLDAFVLFSSIAATWGSGHQPAYAAANAYLDALAQQRRARGLTALSVAWGPWAGGGMADAESSAQMARRGVPPMDPALAVAALSQALDAREDLVTVADVDWARFAAAFTVHRPSPLIADLPEVREAVLRASEAPAGQDDNALARQLAGLSEADQLARLTSMIRTEAALVLGHGSADAIEDGRAFKDLGFDSLTAVEFRDRMAALTGLRMPATLVFDYPTPVLVARFVRAELLGTGAADALIPTAVIAPADEPIAIVGMGCRFPGGVVDPEGLWDLVSGGVDAVGGFPEDRGWDLAELFDPDPDRAGTSHARVGGFVYDVAGFDPGFFGIAPREALAMDPQQRLLLEVCWEALERAGIAPASVRGSRTGVFTGGTASGYGEGMPEESGSEGYLVAGTATSVLSGRVSYVLGLEGPAVTVDTACSSSLVATHLACQALRSGECDLALAGGVAVMVTPGAYVGFSRLKGVSADGRCKSFGAGADGSGWAEGAGIVVLERLSAARANGHRVLAVVAGSAINQDGASNGLTAPNGPSQQRVIRAALANAQVPADQVDVVEAHGSGTVLGDPIEAQALLATYGQGRPQDRPLWLGSVKSNIGHSQQAAGAAGMIKMVLALQHQLLPATLHADEPSPHVDWSAGAVRLLNSPVPWPGDGDRPRRAGVSAFGMSGTNVHIILEEDGAPAASPRGSRGAGALLDGGSPGGRPPGEIVPWLVSARSVEGLAAQAVRLAGWMRARPDLDPGDVGWSLATTRSVFEHRAVVIGRTGQELAAGLELVAAGERGPGAVTGTAGGAGRLVFVFAGQGSQWVGMGRELAGCCPVFAARLADCGRALAPYVDWDLLAVLAGADGAPGLEAGGGSGRAEIVQPVLWAVMVSLAEVWRAAGVTPDAVVGHSQGEIAAATVAGILSLEDAAKVVAVRSRALSGLGADGGMISVVMPAAGVEDLIGRWGDRLAVAAANGPAATVVSGESGALAEFEAELAARHVMRWRIPATDFVAHSANVAGLGPVLERDLAGLEPRAGDIKMFSTVDVRWVGGEELDAGYWFANLRQRVRFDDAVRALADDGFGAFVEISPHPLLEAAIADTLDQGGYPVPVISGTMHREGAGAAQILTALARLHVRGIAVDWAAVLGGGEQVELPTYVFQRERYWSAPLPAGVAQLAVGGDGAETEAEARFWAAVEGGDIGQVSGALAVDGDQPLGQVLPALAAWRRRERDRSVTGSWRYRVAWTPVPDPGQPRLPGTWLVIRPESVAGELADWCQRALGGAGADVLTVTAPDDCDCETLAALIYGTLNAADATAAGVVSLLGLAETAVPEHPVLAAGLAGTLAAVQALGDAGVAAPLWVLTRGAVAAGEQEALASPAQAAVWGLGRVAALEHPDRWGGLIDVPAQPDERAVVRLCGVLAGCDEDQIAIRPAGLFARRLARAGQPVDGGDGWTTSGTALITGGTGAIGGHVARWLAGHGTPRLVLTSRSGPAAAGAAALAAGLAQAGAATTVVACDMGVRAEVAGILARIAASGPQLTAVMHTAGVLDDGLLDRLNTTRLATSMAGKAAGAAYLDELTQDLELDAFVLFSSARGRGTTVRRTRSSTRWRNTVAAAGCPERPWRGARGRAAASPRPTGRCATGSAAARCRRWIRTWR